MNKYYIEIFNSDRERIFQYYKNTYKEAIDSYRNLVETWNNPNLSYNLYQLVFNKEYC